MSSKKPARLGRPPASSSAETRNRILTVAQASFAELGYGVTTNKFVATKAGITTGALYHYFDSKLDIYRAVYEHVQDTVNDRLAASMVGKVTFIDKFEALLETAHEMNRDDPSLALFLGSSRVDIARHDELRDAIEGPGEGRSFAAMLVATAVRTGEIDKAGRDQLRAFLRTVLVGLVDALSSDINDHRVAVDAIKAVVRGQLVKPPKARAPRSR